MCNKTLGDYPISLCDAIGGQQQSRTSQQDHYQHTDNYVKILIFQLIITRYVLENMGLDSKQSENSEHLMCTCN